VTGRIPINMLANVLSGIDPQVHRRFVHHHAELGWCEFATTTYVREHLQRVGVDRLVWGPDLFPSVDRLGVPSADVVDQARETAIEWGVPARDVDAMIASGTGVMAELRSERAGPTIVVRVDMDALPIVESEDPGHAPQTQHFASAARGVMHACGHDGHVAIGLAVTEALAALRTHLAGTIRFIFQPAEEGTRGGVAFVDAGWLDDVDHFISFHLSGLTNLRTGAFSPGVMELLSTIKFDVHLHGRAAHFASAPEKGRSALTAASAIALLAQSLPRRPATRSLINVGRLDAGTARNVVPEHGLLQMEVRAEADDLAWELFRRVERLITGVSAGLEVESEVVVVGRAPAANSDAELARRVASVGQAMGLARFDGLTMEASDDASAMMRRVQERHGKAVYAKVGTDLAGGNHTPTFDLDEASLPIGVELLVRSILGMLQTTGAEH
jgi:aminobenzoyl-glutamate utilization protein A